MRYSKFKPQEFEKRFFLGSLIGGAASLLGSAFGGGGDDDAGKGDVERAVKYLQDQPEYSYLQGIDPTYYQAPTDVVGQTVADSPEFRQKQITGINDLQRLATEGMDAQSIANFNRLRNQAGTEARGRNDAVAREMQSRGMGGGGLELLAKMMSNQGSADTLAQSQMAQAAENARQKQLANEAMIRYSGDVRNADVDLNKTNADILNQFNKYNSANQQMIKNSNIDKLNAYKEAETGERRNIAKGNVELQTNKNQALANAAMQQAGTARQQAAANTGQTRDILGTLGTTAGSVYNSIQQQDQQQKDRDFLTGLLGKKTEAEPSYTFSQPALNMSNNNGKWSFGG